ncbi:MAG TPA: hypothetical protein PK941_05130 [Paludibacter sp.]|jgi:hypothetical protein|nr:hypothetical protein [Paludibacter sp.]
MKTISPNLLKFAGTALLLTIIFRFFLSHGIDKDSMSIVILSAFLYGLAMFFSGWYFGKKDREYLPFYDVGFRFHLATYLSHNLISKLWFVFGFNSESEKISIIHITALIWGIILFFHFLFFLWTRKDAINDLDKDDLFE